MTVREMRPDEAGEVMAMMRALWPDFDDDHIADEAVFVLEHAGTLAGFVALSRRAYAPGCASSPVAFVEGWRVAIDNTTSHAAHAALGFDEIERVVCFRKRLV